MTSIRRLGILSGTLVCLSLASCGGKHLIEQPPDKKVDDEFLKTLSPEQRALFDLWRKIEKGMSEHEVDALLSDYTQERLDLPSIEPEYVKVYDEKRGAFERDFAISVEFDEHHLVIDARLTAYSK